MAFTLPREAENITGPSQENPLFPIVFGICYIHKSVLKPFVFNQEIHSTFFTS
jgi:hypothetical protein